MSYCPICGYEENGNCCRVGQLKAENAKLLAGQHAADAEIERLREEIARLKNRPRWKFADDRDTYSARHAGACPEGCTCDDAKAGTKKRGART